MTAATEMTKLTGARNGDQYQFGHLVEPYRAELMLHCYRMLGSVQEAEDSVQDTLVRAWRSLQTFEGRGSFRAWLYRIATNACLDALDKRSRRVLPSVLYPHADPKEPFQPPSPDLVWLEPYPDARLPETTRDPEAQYTMRESVRLAFLTALQRLPPRQRAVLLLRDVLDWRAKEVAELLDTTVSAVNSALHRARTTLRQHYRPGRAGDDEEAHSDEEIQGLLDRYMRAWDRADVSGLVALLKEDATLTMPPATSWYYGREAIGAFLTAAVFGGETDRWRFRVTRANAQPAFGVYERDPETGLYQAFAIQVLVIQGGQIADIVAFAEPRLFPQFDLPLTWEALHTRRA